MNTTITAVFTFCIGLIIGATILAVCPTPAFEFQDNPSTRWELQQLQREQEQRQRQEYQRIQRQERPC